MEEIFLGVMELQEAKNHQAKLSLEGVTLNLKTNGHTCTTGCKVTVEVWGLHQEAQKLQRYFQGDFLKHVKGHEPNFEHMSSVFDSNATEAICQACGTRFSTSLRECPDCGLVYG